MKFILPTALLLASYLVTPSAQAEENLKRFDGHYKLIRQVEGSESLWNSDCPAPQLISKQGMVSNYDATGKCLVGNKTTQAILCSPELYVKGAIDEQKELSRNKQGQWISNTNKDIFYSDEPFSETGDSVDTTRDPQLSTHLFDRNEKSNSCRQNGETLMECAFEKTVTEGYSKWTFVSQSQLVSNEITGSQKKSSFVSLQKDKGLLILTEAGASSMTNGNGSWVKSQDSALRCVYIPVE